MTSDEQKIWDAATTAERERCEKECEELSNDDAPPYKDYEDTYLNGWLDACNECKWAIHGCVDIWGKRFDAFSALEIPETAKVEMDFFST